MPSQKPPKRPEPVRDLAARLEALAHLEERVSAIERRLA